MPGSPDGTMIVVPNNSSYGPLAGTIVVGQDGKAGVSVSATGQLNRLDFGLNWDGVAGAVPFASHTIKLDLDGEIVVKAAETVAA